MWTYEQIKAVKLVYTHKAINEGIIYNSKAS